MERLGAEQTHPTVLCGAKAVVPPLSTTLGFNINYYLAPPTFRQVPEAADNADHAAQHGAGDHKLRDEDDKGRVVRSGDGINRQHHRHEREAPAATGRRRVHDKL